MVKTVNIIYLDLSLNASSGALTGALVHLAEVMPDLKQTLAQLRIPDVVISLVPSAHDRVIGHGLAITNELGQPMGYQEPFALTKRTSLPPRSPQWDRNEVETGASTSSGQPSGAQTQQQLKSEKGPPKSQRSIWHHESITFLDIKNWLRSTALDVTVQTMCLRVFRKAFDVLEEGQHESSIPIKPLKTLLIHALGCALALDKLNPVGVSCSELPMRHREVAQGKGTFVADWALRLSLDMPTFEDTSLPSADFFSMALLNTFVTDWGLRPRGRIKRIERGVNGTTVNQALAFLITPPELISQKANPNAFQRVLNWDVVLTPQASVSQLKQGLKQLGATNFMVSPMLQDDGGSTSMLKLTLPYHQSRKAQEWCFAEGLAQTIHIYDIQEETLEMQEIKLPWGRGAAQEIVTVVENRWLDRVVRIVPDETDVNRIALQTGFTTEAVRADIMRAYERWAGENASLVE